MAGLSDDIKWFHISIVEQSKRTTLVDMLQYYHYIVEQSKRTTLLDMLQYYHYIECKGLKLLDLVFRLLSIFF